MSPEAERRLLQVAVAVASLVPLAMGLMSVTSMVMLSPGMTISVPSGSLMVPVTSVVRK